MRGKRILIFSLERVFPVVNLSTAIWYEIATLIGTIESLEDWQIRFAVVISQNWLNRLRCRLQMVVGYVEKQVVSDMGTDVVVDIVDQPIIMVNRREGTFEKIPIIAAIPRDIWVSMMHKSDQV